MPVNKRRTIHNIAASIILAPAMSDARRSYAALIEGSRALSEGAFEAFTRAEKAARGAIEAVLIGHCDGRPGSALLKAFRTAIEDFIASRVPDEGGQLTILDCCIHVDTETTWAVRRIYRDDDKVAVEAAQVPDTELEADGRIPAGLWVGLYLDELSLDELSYVVAAIDDGRCVEEAANACYPGTSRTVKKGDKVRWHDPAIADFDPEDRKMQEDRIWTVDAIFGDIARIADEAGEAEVYASELEYLGRRLQKKRA